MIPYPRFIVTVAFFLLPLLFCGKALSDSRNIPTGPPTGEARWSGDGPVRTQFSLTGSYRKDSLDWNIAGELDGRRVDILSELQWNDLTIFQATLANRTTIQDRLCFRGAVGIGRIVAGDNQDSDYAASGRTMEFSRSNNSADDGRVTDVTLGLGYRFDFGFDGFAVAPMAGYSIHEQYLTMTDGYQTLSRPVPGANPQPAGPFPEALDSRYDTRWEGPWLGVDLFLEPKKPFWIFRELEFLLTYEYHWADYDAEADWNLRDDFAHPRSFEHDAEGSGMVFSADGAMRLGDNWWLTVGADYWKWSTGAGTDRLFFASGDVVETRLNEVNWTSWAINCGIVIRF